MLVIIRQNNNCPEYKDSSDLQLTSELLIQLTGDFSVCPQEQITRQVLICFENVIVYKFD